MMAAVDIAYHTSALAFASRSPPVVEQTSSSMLETWGKSVSPLGLVKATRPPQSTPCYLLLVDGQLVIIKQTDDQDTATQHDIPTSQSPVLAERLDWIKGRLALSITQMAELFGVTRKSIYDWYEGKGQRSATSNKMEILIDVLDTSTPADVDLRRLKAVWNIAVSGKSFRAVFGDDELDISTLRKALTEKLHELSPRMVAAIRPAQKTTAHIGEAHLAEFDRRTSFG